MAIEPGPILRPSARVLLIDDQDRVLLLRANVGEGDVWITPGGALEPGETAEDAARRELREETGIESAELSPCVWTRTHRFVWAGMAVPCRVPVVDPRREITQSDTIFASRMLRKDRARWRR